MKITYALLLFFSLFLSGCTKSEESSSYLPHASSAHVQNITFGVHPYLNTKKMYQSYRPILDFIEEQIPDIKFKLETSADYESYNKKLYARRFDISLPNPFQTYNALQLHYRVIARMHPDSVFRGIFVARKDAKIREFSQLKSQNISFPAPTALAATMMPLYYLHQNGLDVTKDIVKKYVGSQYSSILNAYSKDTLIGATWPPPWEAWCKENPEMASEMEVVWQTDPLINNGLIVKEEFDSQLANEIVSILVSLHTHTRGQKLLEDAGFEGFVPSKDSDYDVVAKFLHEYDQVIGIPE